MPIEFACTHCNKQVRVPDGSEGKKCKCPECQTILNVPTVEIETIEMKLEVPCPRCEFFLLCDPALEGTRGLCPNCKLIFMISPPGVTDNVKPEPTIQMTFAFQCPHCKQLFEGKRGMEGRNGKCIHCKQVFEITVLR
jgi:phage FluMu protein Com